MIFLLYSVAFGHNFFFDEESIIVKNPLIRDLSQFAEIFKQPYFYEGLPQISWTQYYRPLTTLTFALDFHFWNVNPLGYNITNTLLQCGVCLLLFKLLSMMINDIFAAFLSVLLFAVHPIHTEAVTYIASRGDVLGALLILMTIYLYWRSQIVLALITHALALLAKESAILIPVYLSLLEFGFIKDKSGKTFKKLLPSVLITLLFLLFRKYICPVPLGPSSNDSKEALLRFFSMGHPFLSYLQTLLLPEVYTFSLAVRFAKSFKEPQVFLSLFIVCLMLVGLVLAARRRGAAFFGMGIFLASFLPYLQIVHFYPEWAEHYLYMPAIGLTILLGSFFKSLRHSGSRTAFLVFAVCYVSLFSFFCYRTWERNKIYNDTEAYFEYLSKSGARYAHFGYQNLGRMALEGGELKKAAVFLRTAAAIEPNSDVTQNLLGLYYLQKGNLQESLNHFDRAFKYNNENQIYRINSCFILMRMGRYREVIDTLEKVQKIVPEYSSVYVNLLAANELLGNIVAAKKWSEEGLAQTKKNEWEQATMLMGAIRLAYREGWDDQARSYLTEIAEKHSKLFWYSDIARMMLGKISPDELSHMTNTRYFGFENSIQSYVLMSYVLQKKWTNAEEYLKKNKDLFDKQMSKQPLLKKEIDRAKDGIALSKTKTVLAH